MKILYVCLDRGVPVGGTKGASVHVDELLRAFEAEGHETAVVARAVAGGGGGRRVFPAVVPQTLGIVPGRVLRRDLRELRAGPRLRRAVRAAISAFAPDAVYERYALFRTEAVAEARRAGIPVALEVNAPLAREEQRFRGLALRGAAHRAEARVWRAADLVVVPSLELEREVRARGQERVLVAPNAVDSDRFAADADGPRLRARLGLDGRLVVGFAGTIRPWHDLETLVDAAAAIAADVPITLLLVGDGPLRHALEEQAAGHGLPLVVTGQVPHDEVPSYLATMDVCFAGLPRDSTLHYFSPLKALEYLAAGRPAVVAAAGELAALADHGAADAYAPGDAAALAARLRSLASDPELRDRLAAAGRELARTRTWRAVARAVVQELTR